MKLWLPIGFCLLLAVSCKCKECTPETANDAYVVEFDTSLLTGFRADELDTIYRRKFDVNMVLLDSNILGLHKQFPGDRSWNLMEGSVFGDLHTETPDPVHYQLQIKGYPKKYTFSDFDVKVIRKKRKDYCACDKSEIEKVSIDGAIINKNQLPFKISK